MSNFLNKHKFQLILPDLDPGSYSTLLKDIEDAERREPNPQAQRAPHLHNQVKQVVRFHISGYLIVKIMKH